MAISSILSQISNSFNIIQYVMFLYKKIHKGGRGRHWPPLDPPLSMKKATCFAEFFVHILTTMCMAGLEWFDLSVCFYEPFRVSRIVC